MLHKQKNVDSRSMTGGAPGAKSACAPWAGLAYLIAAVACFAVLDTTTKWVTGTQQVPLWTALWALFAIQAVLYAVLVVATGRLPLLRASHKGAQLLRGVLLLGVQTLVFLSLGLMPVGEFTAVAMTTPLLVTLLAGPLLGERVSWHRVLLVLGGFAGTLIIVRPGSGAVGWVLLVPLALVLVNAGYQLLTSWMTRSQDILVTLLCTSSVCLLLTSAMVVKSWAPPSDLHSLAGLLLMGVAASVGNLLFVRAFERSAAACLMPFMYLQIGFGVLGGVLVFSHVPDPTALLGIALIAGCGVAGAVLTLHESRQMHDERGA